jgi:GntR family transcriptional regulator
VSPVEPSAALVPLYRQVSQKLLRAIMAGELKPGQAIPTEDALCAKFGVGRITVRRALDELVERHLVVRRQGVGTFVAEPHASSRSVTLTGFIEELLSPNRLVLIREAVVRPPAEVLAFAGLPDDTRLKLYEGTNHFADGSPLVHLHYYFPDRVATYLSADALTGPTPAIKLVEARLGLAVDHADQIVVPMIAGGRIARRLGVARGTAVLRAIRAYYDGEGRPIEIFDAAYHPTHYRYTARLYPRAGRLRATAA